MFAPETASPHVAQNAGVSRLMLDTLYALIPGIVIYVVYFGWGVVINIVLAITAALTAEAVMLRLRKRPLRPFLLDGSAILTAVLLALALPPLSPWWIPVLGCLLAIVLVKQLYGGLGYNPFNPAMAGYAILLISFPIEMTRWTAPNTLIEQGLGLFESLQFSLYARLPDVVTLDALTAATALDSLKTQVGLGEPVAAVRATSPIFGAAAGTGMELVSLAFLGGGLWLLYRRVIAWHIPAAMLVSLAVMAAIFWGWSPDRYASPLFHVAGGAAILGAFFIATDPVTTSTTVRGRLLFGAGCGLLTYVIRTWGGYPDGVAFAVLLMNMAVPVIDHYTRPRTYGHDTGRGS